MMYFSYAEMRYDFSKNPMLLEEGRAKNTFRLYYLNSDLKEALMNTFEIFHM